MRRAAVLAAMLGMACAGCARLSEALFAPQQATADTAGALADSSGATSTANSFGSAIDRLLSGRPRNADELLRIRAAVTQRAIADRLAAGSAQADPTRLAPWHPRVAPTLWPWPDRILVAGAPATAERGMWAYPTPLPDGIPAGEAPYGLELGPVRMPPGRWMPEPPR